MKRQLIKHKLWLKIGQIFYLLLTFAVAAAVLSPQVHHVG